MDINMSGTTHDQQRESAEDFNTTSVIPEFVRKLFRMLEDNSYPDVLFWGIDGTTFVVMESSDFTHHVLPKHYKHCNFASFVRQLNKYDFHKVRNPDDGQRPYGEQSWEFKHPLFQCNQAPLLEGIKRKVSIKPTRIRPTTKQECREVPTRSATASGAHEEVPRSTSVDMMEVKLQMARLQRQLDDAQRNHASVEGRLQDLAEHNNDAFCILLSLQSRMETQDSTIINMIQHMKTEQESQMSRGRDFSSPAFSPADNLLDSYNAIAQASQQQLERLSQRVKDFQLEFQMHANTPHPRSTSINTKVSPLSMSRLQKSTPTAMIYPSFHMTAPPKVHDIDTSLRQANQMPPEGFTLLTLSPKKTQAFSSGPTPATVKSTDNMMRRARIPGWYIPPRVLLVDDDSVFRLLSTRLLQLAGCAIEVAVDGVDALEKLGNNNYDIVLMDIMMPKMDGISATRSIRSYDTQTPIITITSNTTEADLLSYRSSGMNDVLQKPFYQLELNSILEKYCARLMAVHYQPTPGRILKAPGPLRMSMEEAEQERGTTKGKQVMSVPRTYLPTPTTPTPTSSGSYPMETLAMETLAPPLSAAEFLLPSSTLDPPQTHYYDPSQLYMLHQTAPSTPPPPHTPHSN